MILNIVKSLMENEDKLTQMHEENCIVWGGSISIL